MVTTTIGGFFTSTASANIASPSQDQKQLFNGKRADNGEKKVPAVNRSIRPVTIKQAKNASIPSEERYLIDDHEVTSISIIGMVREITKSETFVSFKIEDSTGSLDVKYWLELMSETFRETDSIVNTLKPDDYVTIVGRLQQFNNRKSCIATAISKMTDFNEITYHFLHAICTHLTIGKPLKFMLELNRDTNPEEAILSKPRASPFPDNSRSIVKRAIRQCSDEELGADVKAVVLHLRNVFAESKIMEIIETLSLQGEIYNTNDEYIKMVDY